MLNEPIQIPEGTRSLEIPRDTRIVTKKEYDADKASSDRQIQRTHDLVYLGFIIALIAVAANTPGSYRHLESGC